MTQTAKAVKHRGKVTSYKPQYNLSHFEKFCENKNSFDTFVNYFIKKTYSKEWNNATIHSTTRLSNVMTVSDEAFVFLVLENNWERWLDINNKSQNKYTPVRRGNGNQITTNVLPKYTNINGHPSNDGKNVIRGWSEAGIKRFNELCKIVKKDRKKNADVENQIFEMLRSEMETKRSRKRRRCNTARVKAYVDIDNSDSSNDDNDSEEDSDEDNNSNS